MVHHLCCHDNKKQKLILIAKTTRVCKKNIVLDETFVVKRCRAQNFNQ